MISKKRILGIAPFGTFSGFERAFFDSIIKQGVPVDVLHVDLPLFKTYCTIKSFYPNKSQWGLRRDLAYNTSIQAFKKKSRYVQSKVEELSCRIDLIFQIGTLWDPVPDGFLKPLVLEVEYTSLLSEKRGSEWKRKTGKEREFWINEEKNLYGKAAMICATTVNAKTSLTEDYRIQPDKIVVIGAGVPAPFDAPEPNKSADYASNRVLFVGKGGVNRKGLGTLLDAFKIVKKKIPDAVLTIVGPSIKISGEGVEYLGRIADRVQLKEIYYKSAIFAMPSPFETFGQVFLEAMACKLPCIGTNLDAMPEIIEAGKTGYTIEPGNTDELASRIIKLLSKPDLAREMGRMGYRKLQAEYTWDIVGKKILSVMETVLARA